jgi:uncharacterized membrane protein YciS (DUF1049 family)
MSLIAFILFALGVFAVAYISSFFIVELPWRFRDLNHKVESLERNIKSLAAELTKRTKQ